MCSACSGSISNTYTYFNYLKRTQAALSTLLVCLPADRLPVKLSPVIKALMESLRREQHEPLQAMSAKHLALLLQIALSR